jgi:uncharacterized protein
VDRTAAITAPAIERVSSVDAVRGFALLGILVVNAVNFFHPMLTFENPQEAMSWDGLNPAGHYAMHTLAYGKMVSLFSALFGAGVLFYGRKFEDGPLSRGAGLWYRRNAWLLVFGVVHATLFWYGDILVWYALAGMTILWWVRRLPAAALFGIAAACFLVAVGGIAFMSALLQWLAQAGSEGGGFDPSRPSYEIEVFRDGTFLDVTAHRLFMSVFAWFLIVPLVYGPFVLAMMCAGMALLKTGFWQGDRSAALYAGVAGVCVPVSLGLSYWLVVRDESLGFETSNSMLTLGRQLIVGPVGGIGYASLLILLIKLGTLRVVTGALADVGRMALTNYLSQTIICTTLSYGYGFGLYGSVDYPRLWGIIAGVWAWNIAFSVVWLRVLRFRFGPFEWLWRTLTYMRPVGLGRGK